MEKLCLVNCLIEKFFSRLILKQIMSSSKNLEYKKTAFLTKSNSAFIEEMYVKFINNDPNLPDSWKEYFNEIGDEADVVIRNKWPIMESQT